ncbi:MAG: ABC transporter ATP-binding protein [Clostridia bacterium]|nr:ABC transporter ATP-binding protein [Clostridia bacterium]
MPPRMFEYEKIPKPKSFREVPSYLKKIVSGFFSRLVYVFRLVHETGRWIFAALTVVTILQGIVPVVLTYVSKYLLNALQTMHGKGSGIEEFTTLGISSDNILFLLIAMSVLGIFNTVIWQVSGAITKIASERVTMQVRIRIMQKAKETDIAAFDLPAFYEKLENANREAGHRPLQIIQSIFGIISTSITMVSFVLVLATAPGMWWSALIIIAVSVPSAIISLTFRKKNFFYMRFRSKERRQMNYYSNTMVNKDMAKELRIYGLGDVLIDRFKSIFEIYFKGIRKLILSESVWHVAISVISTATHGIFFAMLAFMVFMGKILIGDYSLYIGAITSIGNSVSNLISTSASVYEGTLFIDNLMSFMNEKPTVVPSVKVPERVKHGGPHSIEFCNVSFSYPGSDKAVLQNINLKFNPGETVVLVGLNGAGKTTLIKLLTRLYDPTEGVILLDGKDLRSYAVEDVYKTFGIIFQDFGKYAFTVEENIRFGDVTKKAEEGDVRRAAALGDADGFISDLPDGYDTPLMRHFEENGTELSIGQWQKLAIARAFYSDHDILILDEPTASLDPMAEQEIYTQFDMLRQNKTSIFVSHRLSSATIASKIVVLEYGKVIEEGTHAQLMASQGKYFELFSTQAKRYIESQNEE